MNTNSWLKFKKIETILLGILLYCILLVYFYQFFQIKSHCFFNPDEYIYYLEAKAISAHNIYHTPFSLDGNTSIIGHFGNHGICYAIKDAWLSKLFFHAQDPPQLLINFITSMVMLSLILLFKPFSLNTRLKIALVVATHYVLYSYTYTYMQETIQFLFAVLALRILYLLYQQPNPASNKYLYYYLLLIILAITFRYTWAIWWFGLLPLATNFKNFSKWLLVLVGLLSFGMFLNHFICAPYPFNHLILAQDSSVLNSVLSIWAKFKYNFLMYFTPDERFNTTCMRYLLPVLLLVNSLYAVIKRTKYTMTCSIISWCYFFACLAFYTIDTVNDERFLSVLSPVLAFSLIGNSNSFIFYFVIALQLWLFPSVAMETNTRNKVFAELNASSPERISKEASYSRLINFITDDQNVVIEIPNAFTWIGSSNYIYNFPLVTKKGYSIHYLTAASGGTDLRTIQHPPNYKLALFPFPPLGNSQLIYSDKWMYLYRILN